MESPKILFLWILCFTTIMSHYSGNPWYQVQSKIAGTELFQRLGSNFTGDRQLEVFYKKGVFKDFAIFTGKYLNYLFLLKNHRVTFSGPGERSSSHLKVTKVWFSPNIKYLTEPFFADFRCPEGNFCFTLKSLFVLKIFKYFSWLSGHIEKRLDLKDKVNLKIHYVTTEKKTIATHILLNISRSKGNQIMKPGQSIEYNMRKSFLEKSYKKCRGKSYSQTLFLALFRMRGLGVGKKAHLPVFPM